MQHGARLHGSRSRRKKKVEGRLFKDFLFLKCPFFTSNRFKKTRGKFFRPSTSDIINSLSPVPFSRQELHAHNIARRLRQRDTGHHAAQQVNDLLSRLTALHLQHACFGPVVRPPAYHCIARAYHCIHFLCVYFVHTYIQPRASAMSHTKPSTQPMVVVVRYARSRPRALLNDCFICTHANVQVASSPPGSAHGGTDCKCKHISFT